jgi:glycosyltransferase involved in cell wall biosynthesis
MRLRIAFFTPLCPLQTALAGHSEGLLPHLARHADLDLFIDEGYQPSNPAIVEQFDLYPHTQFPHRAIDYDLAVYVMGNNHDHHGYMHDLMRYYPGIVLFHDTEFQSYFVRRTLGHGNPDGYRAEMEYAYGLAGRYAADLFIAGQVEEIQGAFPLVERMLDWCHGAVVYDAYAYRDLRLRRPGTRVWRLNPHFDLPAGFPAGVDVAALRRRWGLGDTFVIGVLGPFTSGNCLEVCLQAFNRLLQIRPGARCLLVGAHPEGYDVAKVVRALGLEGKIVCSGQLPPAEFAQHLLVPDLAIYLRHSHSGGTLHTPLRLLGLGRPTILSEIEPLAGFPEGCCAKVPPGEGEEDLLLALMARLTTDGDLRRRLGDNARRFVQHHHGVARVARQHLDLFENMATDSTWPVPPPDYWRRRIVQETGTILADWGLGGSGDALLSPIAQTIEEIFPLTPATNTKDGHAEESH